MRVILLALVRLLTFRFRRRASLELELIALRHQLGVLQRTKRHPPMIRPADRLIWGWLYRLHPQALHWLRIAKPDTVIRWHRRGFLYYWRYKSRRRGSLPKVVKGEVRRLIFEMYSENAGWGAGRIHGELQKLGYKLTKRTVSNWLKRAPPRPPPGWRTFLNNHMHDAAAMDMFVVVTMSFRLLYAAVILSLDRRKILRINATEHPTQNWLANEVTEAFANNPRPNYLVRDRDRSYGRVFRGRVRELGIKEHVTAKQSPWQNTYVERVIWTIRRECLDHVIIMSEGHLRQILNKYVEYYNRSRTHFALDQDCPTPRVKQSLGDGKRIISISQVGGLHHRYERHVGRLADPHDSLRMQSGH
jgi:transposase InsO family protein